MSKTAAYNDNMVLSSSGRGVLGGGENRQMLSKPGPKGASGTASGGADGPPLSPWLSNSLPRHQSGGMGMGISGSGGKSGGANGFSTAPGPPHRHQQQTTASGLNRGGASAEQLTHMITANRGSVSVSASDCGAESSDCGGGCALDCGVHGPPELDSALEAMLSFDATADSVRASASGSGCGDYNGGGIRLSVPGSAGAHYQQSKSTSAENDGSMDVSTTTPQQQRVMTGWAAIAAREPAPLQPPPPPHSTTAAAAAAAWRLQHQQQMGPSANSSTMTSSSLSTTQNPATASKTITSARGIPGESIFSGSRLSARLQAEILELIATIPGLKVGWTVGV